MRRAVFAAISQGPVHARNNRIAAYGHSFITQTYNSGVLLNWTFLVHLRQRSYGAVDFCIPTVKGHSGKNSSSSLGNLGDTAVMDADIAAVVPYDPGCIVMALNRNDPGGGITAAQSVANQYAIINYWQTKLKSSLGRLVPVVLIDGSPDAANNQAALLAVAQATRAMHNPAKGIYVANTYNTLVTTTDGLTPITNALQSDGVHPAPLGGARMATAIWSLMATMMPGYSQLGLGNVLFGGEFSGSGGSLAAGTGTVTPTGSMPTGYSLTFFAGASAGTLATSLVTQDGHTWLQLAANGLGNSTSNVQIVITGSSNQIATVTPGTDYIDQSCLYEMDAGGSGLGGFALGCARQSGGLYKYTGTAKDANDAYWGGTTTTYEMDSQAESGMLRAPHVLVDGTATFLQSRWDILIANSKTWTGTLRFALPQFRKYTGLLLD